MRAILSVFLFYARAVSIARPNTTGDAAIQIHLLPTASAEVVRQKQKNVFRENTVQVRFGVWNVLFWTVLTFRQSVEGLPFFFPSESNSWPVLGKGAISRREPTRAVTGKRSEGRSLSSTWLPQLQLTRTCLYFRMQAGFKRQNKLHYVHLSYRGDISRSDTVDLRPILEERVRFVLPVRWQAADGLLLVSAPALFRVFCPSKCQCKFATFSFFLWCVNGIGMILPLLFLFVCLFVCFSSCTNFEFAIFVVVVKLSTELELFRSYFFFSILLFVLHEFRVSSVVLFPPPL